jgi:DNA-binding LacI/PurR family transcriptional regulator
VFGIRHAFHADLVEALHAAAEPAGYDLALSPVAPSRDERRAVRSLLDQDCEALILLGPDQRAKALAELAATTPVVVVGRKVQAEGVDVIRGDDTDGMRKAVQYLVSLGHRRIVHVDGGRAPGAAERRVGYKNAMRRAGLGEQIWVVAGGVTEEAGAAAAKRILREAPKTTAVAVFNDRSAVGLLDAVRRSGRAVPEQLSVVGYGDSSLARLPHIDLTTVGHDAREVAELAFKRAVARLGDEAGGEAGKPCEADELVLPPSLVARGSTAKPPAG